MKQEILDKLEEKIDVYRSQIADRYDFEIVEPIKENSEIAIVFSLKYEKRTFTLWIFWSKSVEDRNLAVRRREQDKHDR